MINLTAALLQPVVGILSDSHPKPMLLPIGMLFTMGALLLFRMLRISGWLWSLLC